MPYVCGADVWKVSDSWDPMIFCQLDCLDGKNYCNSGIEVQFHLLLVE